MTRFYLGTHMANWLATSEVPLFISRNRLKARKSFPRARSPWVLDSGGFTELRDYGKWRISPQEYVTEVRRYSDAIGRMEWAAPMDWMCEPWVIEGGVHDRQTFVGTGLSVAEHQRLTVDNYLELVRMAPDLPFAPVLQGWELEDYIRCAEMYEAAGIDLKAAPVVGLGSVCRRQATQEIAEIARTFSARGYRLHGFGVKTLGLGLYAADLISADSLAWSMDARRKDPISGHTHKNCANCPDWAYRWHARIVAKYLESEHVHA